MIKERKMQGENRQEKETKTNRKQPNPKIITCSSGSASSRHNYTLAHHVCRGCGAPAIGRASRPSSSAIVLTTIGVGLGRYDLGLG